MQSIAVIGYEGLYFATRDGRIFNSRNRELKFWKSPDGYSHVVLYKGGRKKRFLTHRLVATTYIPNPKGKSCINHKDGNKLNNHTDNLEWVTRSENDKHAFKLGLKTLPTQKGENNTMAKLIEKEVITIREMSTTDIPRKDIYQKFGIARSTYYDIINRRNWSEI